MIIGRKKAQKAQKGPEYRSGPSCGVLSCGEGVAEVSGGGVVLTGEPRASATGARAARRISEVSLGDGGSLSEDMHDVSQNINGQQQVEDR
jgi:hypothetical protein